MATLPWSDVAASGGFKALPPDQQEAARQQYFSEVVAPHVPRQQLDNVRQQFDADTKPQPQQSLGDQALQFGKEALQSGGRQIVGALTGIPEVFANGTAAAANLGADALGVQRPFQTMPGDAMRNALSPVLGQSPGGIGGVAEAVGSGLLGSKIPIPGQAAGNGLAAAQAVDQQGGTLGMQTGNQVAQYVERALSRIPGGGSLLDAVRTAKDKLASTTDQIVDNLRGGSSAQPEATGSMLKDSLGKAADRINAARGAPFDAIDAQIPYGTKINSTNTRNVLNELTAVPTGGANFGGMLVSPQLKAMRDALEKDVAAAGGSGAMPIDALRAWKTRLGGMIDWNGFGSSSPENRALKQVWGGLKDDIMDGAAAINPRLAPQIAAANAQYSVAQAQLENLGRIVDKSGGPEKIFTSLMSGTKDGASNIRQVVSQLQTADRQLLAAAQLRRMGQATPGAQDASGQVFSADTFLTNWSRMHPEARAVLFGTLPDGYADSVTQLANNVGKLKSYEQMLSNRSGTTHAAIWTSELATALTSMMTGHWQIAAGIAGGAAGTKMLSTALTNPQTTKYLAQRTGIAASKAAAATIAALRGQPPADNEPSNF